jgi:hypothetical protein
MTVVSGFASLVRVANKLALSFLRSLVGNALSVLLITLVMRVLVDIPLAALLSQVAIAG